MKLTTLSKKYNTRAKCIRHLEDLRYGKGRSRDVYFPFCASLGVTKRKNSIKYHCNGCNKDFSVLMDTIFENTRLELPKWFQIIALMLNSKRGISSSELSRHLDISYKTAWYCQMRVWCTMVDPFIELEGMVEMDESFIGGKPCKSYKHEENVDNLSKFHNKRGRGANRIPMVRIVEKKGKVSTKVIYM